MEVLQNKAQITAARKKLVQQGVSSIDSSWRTLLRRLRLWRGVCLGEQAKSWDVATTLDFIDRNLPRKDEPILDIGCYASELIVALHKYGYSNLTGIDLNPALEDMPYRNSIRYVRGDFMQTRFDDASFQAITSISVIEHGFDGPSLLQEMSRLLRPGGFFIASFDYWPEKVDTTGIKFFGMDWRIFSRKEIIEFVGLAREYGLVPVGEISFEVDARPIACMGKSYTFGWLALKKAA